MCGIAGVLDRGGTRNESDTESLLVDMCRRMVPRGPDGSGTWVDPRSGIGLGHRRLSIIDLSEQGAQPMVSRDGRWVITYNGEIYDHRELASQLAGAGVELRGHSDTEVLLESIAHQGLEATLDRVDGMYAFGLWDRSESRLTLVRDRMGEKPLYYGRLGSGEFVFASTLDALSAHPEFDRPLDRNALALYLRYKYVPAPWSIREGISKLEPGCTVEVGADGRVGDPRAYWSYFEVVEGAPGFGSSANDAVDELDGLLRRSIERRLIADVPVGAFLSGGIDSSTVVAVAQQVSNEPVRTFTIGSTDRDYDEAADARAVATHLGTHHTELVVTEADALSVVQELGSIYDEPFADSSQVPTRLVAELASREVSVALSGDGGDELFLGYNRYAWVPTIWRQLSRVPLPVRRTASRLGGRVAPNLWDRAAFALPAARRPRMLGLKVSKVLGVGDADSPFEVYNRLVGHWQDPSALVPGSSEPPTIHNDPSRWPATAGIVEHMATVDAVTYLPDDVLAKVDRATMSVSLEGRVPLLDRSVVEFAAGLPPSVKNRGGRSKWPLRQLLERYVPSELVDRPKSGFGVPIEAWIRGPLKGWAAERIFEGAAAELLDLGPVRSAWQDHQAGRRNSAYELWDVIMFSVWAEHRNVT